MTDFTVKINLRQVYPIEIFNNFEGLEINIKYNNIEEKQRVSVVIVTIISIHLNFPLALS